MEFSQIDEQVFIGTNKCCVDHFKIGLLDRGVSCDISLEGEMLDQPFGVECFVWLPTPDHTAPTRQNIDVGVAALDEMMKQGRKVYIHCKNGHGRAPTFYAAYLVMKQRLSVEDALARISSKRPEMHLDAAQLDLLHSLIRT